MAHGTKGFEETYSFHIPSMSDSTLQLVCMPDFVLSVVASEKSNLVFLHYILLYMGFCDRNNLFHGHTVHIGLEEAVPSRYQYTRQRIFSHIQGKDVFCCFSLIYIGIHFSFGETGENSERLDKSYFCINMILNF
jgi:hypothetical protein